MATAAEVDRGDQRRAIHINRHHHVNVAQVPQFSLVLVWLAEPAENTPHAHKKKHTLENRGDSPLGSRSKRAAAVCSENVSERKGET